MQVWKFYLQILNTEVSFYIYDSELSDTTVTVKIGTAM